MQISPKYWLLIILLGTLWGAAFLFAKIAVQEIAPLTLVLLRVGFGGLILWIFIFLKRTTISLGKADIIRWFVMGLLANALPFALLFHGQRDIGAGLASIINGSTVFWTAMFAHLFLRDEKLTLLKLVGIVIGFFGIIVMIGPETLNGLGKNVIAQLLVVATAISYGLAAVYSRRFANSDPLVSAAGQLTGATVLIFPLVILIENPVNMSLPSLQTLSALTGLIVFSTALAYGLYFKIVSAVGAVNVSLCTFVVPIVAVLLGSAILNEQLTLTQWVGMLAILLGMLTIDGRIFQKRTVLKKIN